MSGESTERPVNIDRTEHHSALAVGLMIGRYKIVSVLGQGGFGITYLCHDTQLHRDVAIKEYLPSGLAIRQDGTTVLPRSTEMSKDFVWGRSRFLDEARTMARLGHAPAVVRVHDFLEAHGTAYVVMHLLEGETLEQRLKRETRLSQAVIDRILPPLLDGLEQIHAVGFLHRDIKPANIMLAPDGSPTLIDFGASRVAIAGRSQAMTAVFTPGYAAPEQSTSGKQGPWTDIYSLAATLYTCVNGKPPPSVMERVFESVSAASDEATARDYAPNLLAAIDAGLLLKANARPQSIDAWRQVLVTGGWSPPEGPSEDVRAQAAADTRVVHRPAEAQPEAAKQAPAATTTKSATLRRRKPIVLAGAAMLVLAIAGCIIYAASGSRRSADPASSPAASATPPATATAAAMPAAPAATPVPTPAPSPTPIPALPAASDAAARRAAEEQRLAAEEAANRARRQQEQAAAKAAEEEKARAEAATKPDEETRRNAERGETELRLSGRDRQKLQVALTSLGFDVGGIDGSFGPRSRQMIANWQTKKGELATGYMTATQNAALLAEGAPAIARWEEAQRRAYAEEQRRQPQAPQPQRRSGWRWPWE